MLLNYTWTVAITSRTSSRDYLIITEFKNVYKVQLGNLDSPGNPIFANIH